MLAAAPVAVASAVPTVHVMVSGRGGGTYLPPRAVRARAVTVRASGKRCAVGAGTPLAALVATGVSLRIRDYGGSCSRRAADAGGLFVVQVGADRNRGRDGWVYKVGGRVGTAGAGDPSGPFGRGRLRSGAELTWFWCVLSRRGACQRTLALRPAARRVRRGRQLSVTVFGVDDEGRRVRVAGATVSLAGGIAGVSGPDGVAVVRALARPGGATLTATRRGMVRAFPLRVRIG